jgi:hypothetical protein
MQLNKIKGLEKTDRAQHRKLMISDRVNGLKNIAAGLKAHAAESRAGVHVSPDPFAKIADGIKKIPSGFN